MRDQLLAGFARLILKKVFFSSFSAALLAVLWSLRPLLVLNKQVAERGQGQISADEISTLARGVFEFTPESVAAIARTAPPGDKA